MEPIVPAVNDKHVVLLGAGFSRAVSSTMPLTDELGRQAAELLETNGVRVGAAQLGFGRGVSFESWLTLLSEDQPHLTDAENRDNAALFAHLRDAIANILMRADLAARGRPAPSWLYELVSVLHRRRATVLTLNYDTLVETAVESHSLWDPAIKSRAAPIDILHNLPPLPNVGARVVGPLCRTFRLLKLHGSLDWWAVPHDTSGATLNREETRGTFGAPYEMSSEQRQRELPGRERFIIPPLSTKSTYYQNPLTRELWQQAYQALQGANRISIVGYSLPSADLVMANMLRGALSNREVAVDVVNPDPDALAERLVGLGAAAGALKVTCGSDCVASFTRSLCGEAAAVLTNELRETVLVEAPDASLAVAWGDPNVVGASMRPVAELSVRCDRTLELVLEEYIPRAGATAARFSDDGAPSAQHFPSANDVASLIERCERVVARDADGEHTLIRVLHLSAVDWWSVAGIAEGRGRLSRLVR